jgi:hypothetical protein
MHTYPIHDVVIETLNGPFVNCLTRRPSFRAVSYNNASKGLSANLLMHKVHGTCP